MLERDVKQLRGENDQLTEEVKKLKMNQSTMIIRHLEAIKQQRSSKHDYYQDDCIFKMTTAKTTMVKCNIMVKMTAVG